MKKRPFNIHAARRLEKIRLSALREASAVQRETDLNALRRAAAARGIAMSGGLLQQEVEIIFSAAEMMIDTAIAYRKELTAKAPDLLLAFPHLKEFHATLDQMADGALISLQQRHAAGPSAGRIPASALNAVIGVATRRAKILKNKINGEIQAMALEGTLGMHEADQPQVNISNSTIANLNLGTVFGDLNGSIQTLITTGHAQLAEALRQLTEAVTASGELVDKKEIIENLAYVSEQAALPAEQREAVPL